jgi:hypothetical protein
MSTIAIAAELEALADRIARMRAVGRNGDLDPFLVDRSQARHDARSIAKWLRTGHQPPDFKPAAERDPEAGRTHYSNGRG